MRRKGIQYSSVNTHHTQCILIIELYNKWGEHTIKRQQLTHTYQVDLSLSCRQSVLICHWAAHTISVDLSLSYPDSVLICHWAAHTQCWFVMELYMKRWEQGDNCNMCKVINVLSLHTEGGGHYLLWGGYNYG